MMTQKTLPRQINPNTTFLDHIQELRFRFLSYVLILVVNSVVGYLLHDTIFEIITKPLGQPLYYSTPAGGFDFVLSLSILFGFITSIPVLVFHVVRFISPAFPQIVDKLAPFMLASTVFMLLGILFAYYVGLPGALYFLGKFSTSNVTSLISTDSYISFVSRYLLGFALLFQLPIVLLIVNKVKRLHFAGLLKFERWVIAISFILAAILTPTPDAVNQIIMAVPIILLYQISIFVVFIANRRSCAVS